MDKPWQFMELVIPEGGAEEAKRCLLCGREFQAWDRVVLLVDGIEVDGEKVTLSLQLVHHGC